MMMKRLIICATLCTAFVAGCDSNPTNEPTPEDINKAVDNKYSKIDNDPSLSQAQKDEMKKHMTGKTRNRDGSSN